MFAQEKKIIEYIAADGKKFNDPVDALAHELETENVETVSDLEKCGFLDRLDFPLVTCADNFCTVYSGKLASLDDAKRLLQVSRELYSFINDFVVAYLDGADTVMPFLLMKWDDDYAYAIYSGQAKEFVRREQETLNYIKSFISEN